MSRLCAWAMKFWNFPRLMRSVTRRAVWPAASEGVDIDGLLEDSLDEPVQVFEREVECFQTGRDALGLLDAQERLTWLVARHQKKAGAFLVRASAELVEETDDLVSDGSFAFAVEDIDHEE